MTIHITALQKYTLTPLHIVYPRGDYNSGPSEIRTKLEMVDQFRELRLNNQRNLGTSGLG